VEGRRSNKLRRDRGQVQTRSRYSRCCSLHLEDSQVERFLQNTAIAMNKVTKIKFDLLGRNFCSPACFFVNAIFAALLLWRIVFLTAQCASAQLGPNFKARRKCAPIFSNNVAPVKCILFASCIDNDKI